VTIWSPSLISARRAEDCHTLNLAARRKLSRNPSAFCCADALSRHNDATQLSASIHRAHIARTVQKEGTTQTFVACKNSAPHKSLWTFMMVAAFVHVLDVLDVLDEVNSIYTNVVQSANER